MNAFFILIVFNVLLGCVAADVRPSAVDMGKPEHPIVSGCTIQDASGRLLWTYPSWLCIFLPDGRFVSGGDEGVTLHAPDHKPIWHLDLVAHHMMSLTENGDILVLVSDWKPIAAKTPPFKFTYRVVPKRSETVSGVPRQFSKEKFRIDRIVRINPAGQIVGDRSLLNDEDYPIAGLRADFTQAKSSMSITPFEGSHLNTIYEIRTNTSSIPAFKAGNILVHDNWNGLIFVLDPDLKKILWRLPTDILGYVSVHDVQLLTSGRLLLFRNLGIRTPDSSLEEFDPATLLDTWKYFDLEGKWFRAPAQGSVQELSGGRHLFAYASAGKPWVKMLDANDKVVWELDMSRHFDASIQGAYSLPVESFLQHSKPL